MNDKQNSASSKEEETFPDSKEEQSPVKKNKLDNSDSDSKSEASDSEKSESEISGSEIMENSMRIPPPLSFEGNIKDKWLKWVQRFNIYLAATGLDSKSQERQVAVFLNLIGEEGLEKFNTFGLTENQKKVLDDVKKSFADYCSPKTNETVERYMFFMRNQESGESFNNYLTALKTLSATCGFGNLNDSLIKDRIVCGISNPFIKKTVAICIEIA